jgi:AmmeMemoRadiSam system protein A
MSFGNRMLTADERRALLEVAARAIEHALRTHEELALDPAAFPEALRERRATFVTLERDGQLLGCIGSLAARTSMVEDVAKNAYGAIFHDPRCPRLAPSDAPDVGVHISILSPAAPMRFRDEEDLVRQLRPGVDGLLLEDHFSRGTFLPSVWESLPDPHDFFTHLKLKAGLPPTYWSDTMRVSRYTTEVVE